MGKAGVPLCPFCGSRKVSFNAYHAVWHCGNCEQVFPSPSHGSYRWPGSRRDVFPADLIRAVSAFASLTIKIIGWALALVVLGLLLVRAYGFLTGSDSGQVLNRMGQNIRAVVDWGACAHRVIALREEQRAVYEGLRENDSGRRLLPRPVWTWDPRDCPDPLDAVAQAPPSAQTTTPLATPPPWTVLTPTNSPIAGGAERTSTATLTPATGTPTSARRSLDTLKAYALDLINADRQKHGVPLVRLGDNPAAQWHAEDMLENFYLSHWNTRGLKPYMLYTLAGGLGYVAENAAYSGWFDPNERQTRYRAVDPIEAIGDHQYGMMYDDADSDWGHRDNIINPLHETVNLGIAFDGKRLAYVQHFEQRRVTFQQQPALVDGWLRLTVTLLPGTGELEAVSLYHDPPPRPMTPAQLNAGPRSYSLGTGKDPAAHVLPPLPPGYHYTSLDLKGVVADTWVNGPTYSVLAQLGTLVKQPGVYTVVLWGSDLERPLSSISLFVGIPIPTMPSQ